MITNALNAMHVHVYFASDAAIKIYKDFFNVYMLLCHYKLYPGSWHSPAKYVIIHRYPTERVSGSWCHRDTREH